MTFDKNLNFINTDEICFKLATINFFKLKFDLKNMNYKILILLKFYNSSKTPVFKIFSFLLRKISSSGIFSNSFNFSII